MDTTEVELAIGTGIALVNSVGAAALLIWIAIKTGQYVRRMLS